MHAQFRTYRLNEAGQQKAQHISEAFDELLTKLEGLVPEGRQLALCRTQLEQACFFAKKGMAEATGNQADSQREEHGKPTPTGTQHGFSEELQAWAQKDSKYNATPEEK